MKEDFYAKLTIAYKEVRETRYWLKLLVATDYSRMQTAESLLKEIEEICSIIGAIQKTIKAKKDS